MKKIIVTLGLLVLSINISAQSPWIWQNPIPQGNTLYDVQFLNSETGYSAGGIGTVLKTTNSGLYWATLNIGTISPTKTIYFFDINTGYATGNTEILKTSNGGGNWQQLYNINAGSLGYISKIIFLNANTGYLSTLGGKVLKTTDGGLNWNIFYLSAMPLYSITFINDNTGITAGYEGLIYRTTNAGTNWEYQDLNISYNLNSIFFTDANTGYVAGGGGFLRKTTNAGANWNIIMTTGTNVEITDIYFINQTTGIITGNNGAVLRTTNEGSTWQLLYTGSGLKFRALDFCSNSTAFAVGDGGIIYKTTNTGLGWAPVSGGSPRNLCSMKFVNSSTGYAIGDSGTVLKTTNRGAFWQVLNQVSIWRLNSMHFFDVNTGIVVGAGGLITKTTDGGNSWASTNSGINYITSVCFVDDNTGYSVGDWDVIRKTTNKGDTWFVVNPLNLYYLRSVIFTSANTGYAAGYLGKLIKTTNAGANWTTIDLSMTTSFNCIYFLNSSTGFICGDNGVIVNTTNDGSTWLTQNSGTNNLTSICFIDNNTGYIAGNNGTILKTTNGGIQWVSISSPTTYNFKATVSDGIGNIYAAGEYGTILKMPVPTSFFSISGTIKFADNGQPVTSGRVKALKYDNYTHQILELDSAVIQPNGTYTLPHVPQDSVDIMAFQDDEDNAAFVPTYYVSTIYWQNSATLYPTSNLTGIDVNVIRNNLSADNKYISGIVTSSNLDASYALNGAIVYAKINGIFKGYSKTNLAGNYNINKLQQGTYDLIVDCLGYVGASRQVQLNGSFLENINFTLESYLIGVDPKPPGIPEDFWLGQNYPNPFNPETEIKFGVPKESFVVVKIYDILGREAGTLVNEELKAGEYKVKWNASGLSSGIYIYRLEAAGIVISKKLVLIK